MQKDLQSIVLIGIVFIVGLFAILSTIDSNYSFEKNNIVGEGIGSDSPKCQDECLEGKQGCDARGLPWQCGQSDDDLCLDRVYQTPCTGENHCLEGICTTEDCFDKCVVGRSGCNDEGLAWVCGEANDGDSCVERVFHTCNQGSFCSEGNCIPCQNECVPGTTICKGGMVVTCEEYQGCYKERTTSCNSGETCQAGQCQNIDLLPPGDGCGNLGQLQCNPYQYLSRCIDNLQACTGDPRNELNNKCYYCCKDYTQTCGNYINSGSCSPSPGTSKYDPDCIATTDQELLSQFLYDNGLTMDDIEVNQDYYQTKTLTRLVVRYKPLVWSSIPSMKNLKTLWLPGCELHTVPSLNALTKLESLDLSNNKLTGEFPITITNLRHLNTLFLPSNDIEGDIPTEISKLVNLKDLHLYWNNLTGGIDNLKGLSNLERLSLWGNQFSGNIPSEIGLLTNLRSLHLNENNLVGGIPFSFKNLTHLTVLRLASNELSGSIPSWLGQLTYLQTLDLSYNNFTGQIPYELGYLEYLQYLYLGQNELTGGIPLSFSSFSSNSNHQQFGVGNNYLSGIIPNELNNLLELNYFIIANNCFELTPLQRELCQSSSWYVYCFPQNSNCPTT